MQFTKIPIFLRPIKIFFIKGTIVVVAGTTDAVATVSAISAYISFTIVADSIAINIADVIAERFVSPIGVVVATFVAPVGAAVYFMVVDALAVVGEFFATVVFIGSF